MKKATVFLIVFIVFCNSVFSADYKTYSDIEPVKVKVYTNPEKLNAGEKDFPAIALTGTANFYAPAKDEGKLPVIMIPGLGLSSYIFMETPDGREGWAQIFAENGYPVYVYDDPSLFVHEGIDYEKYQDGTRKWDTQRTWRTWGMGQNYPEPYENTRYPVKYFDKLVASFPQYTGFNFLTGGAESKGRRAAQGDAQAQGRRSAGNSGQDQAQAQGRRSAGNSGQGQAQGRRGSGNSSEGNAQGRRVQAAGGEGKQGEAGQGRSRGADANNIGTQIKVQNLLSLIDEVGDCILMVHSASGVTGFEAIRVNKASIKSLIVLEPVGSPVEKKDVKENFAEIPFLGVYGDNVDKRRQTARKEAVETTIKLIKNNKGQANMLDLPQKEIFGNTHLMMQDNNNKEIAELIRKWLAEQKL